MFKFLKYIYLMLVLLVSVNINANHIVGASIQYECIGGNDYKVFLHVYKNCDQLTPLAPLTPVGVSYNCSSYDGNFSLALTSVHEISQICDENLLQTTCNDVNGIYPGVELYVYEGIVTIGSLPGEYRIGWNGQGFRSETINIDNTGLDETLNIYTTIIKEDNLCNNSAVLSNHAVPYFCLGQEANFNFIAHDPDQDSLVYSFAAAQQNSGFCSSDLDYESGFSGSSPITGSTINPLTGQINFTPTMSPGAYTIVVRIDEYRNQQFVGNSFIDVQFIVLLCPNSPPYGTTLGVNNFSGDAALVSPNQIAMCSDQSFCFDYSFESNVNGAILEVEHNLSALFPTATISTSGTNPITVNVCYTAEIGDYSGVMVFNVSDDNCPVSGISSTAVYVSIITNLELGEDEIICEGGSTQLNAIGDVLVNWEVLNGDPIIFGSNFSCNNCANPIASPSETTTYIATGLNLTESCDNKDTLTVIVGLEANINFQAETCNEDDGFINVQMTKGSGDYSLDVNGVEPSFDSNNYWELLGIGDGTFAITITDNISSCSIDTTFTLEAFSVPLANAGNNTTICGLTFQMEAVASSGIGTWTNNDPEIDISDINNPNAIITADEFGSYTLTWTENNGANCSDSDQVTITFVDAPAIDAGDDDQVCGFVTQLNGSGSSVDGQWQPLAGITFYDINNPMSNVSSSTEGVYDFVWEEDNGFGCLVRDTVTIELIEIPNPDAGIDDQVCSLNKTLQAVPSIGSGQWSGSSDLTFSNIFDPNSEVTSAFEGIYNIEWVEKNNTCTESNSVEIIFTEQPIAYAGLDTLICGLQYELHASTSNGVGEWTVDDSSITFDDISSEFSGTDATSFGTYNYTWTETNLYCTDSDAVTIIFLDSPVADAGIGDEICGLGNITMSATLSTGEGEWTYPTEMSTIDDSDPNGSFSATTYGEYTLIWTESDATCYTEDQVTISFWELPNANAGEDLNICGLTANLAGVPSLGVGTWSGTNIDFITDIHAYNSQIISDNFGVFNYTWTEENGICSDSDDLAITFITNEIPNAGEDDITCDSSYVLNAVPVVGGLWANSIQGNDTLIDQSELNNPNALLVLPDFGTYGLTWFDPTCGVGDPISITFLETPSPNAGSDIINCGLSVEMNATESSWETMWILQSGLSTLQANAHNASITAGNSGLYTVTLQESNGECIATDDIDVQFIDIPQPDVGPDALQCDLNYILNASTDGFNGQWSSTGELNYVPSSTSASVSVTAGEYGNQIIYWSETDATGTCSGLDSLMVIFNNAPDTTNFEINCFNTNTQYDITFDIIGGDEDSYVLPGLGTLIGSSFASETYNTHDSYNFTVNDIYDCDELIISDEYSCPSLTYAGILNPDTLFICTDDSSSVSFLDPTFVDANDVSLFVIHTNPGATLGTALAENYYQPEFNFDSNLTLNTVYYLSSVVGDSLENGQVNYNDVNLSVSLGVPIIFSPPPTLLIDETVVNACTDEGAIIDYTLDGSPNWDLTYTYNNNVTLLNDINSVQNNITLNESGTLYFNEISNRFCAVNISDSIVVNVFENPTFELIDVVEFCTADEYLIPLELTGSAPWNVFIQDESLQTIDTMIFISPAQISVDSEGYYYIVNLSDQYCPYIGDIDSIFVDVLPSPESFNAEDVEICFGETVTIGESNVPGLFYEWSNEEWLNSQNISNPIVDIPIDTNVTITYPFVVEISNNLCISHDTVLVMVNPLPYDFIVDPVDPFCVGDQTMLNVTGPYDFIWSPNQDLSDPEINNPITSVTENFIYTLFAEDANGCTTSTLVPIEVLPKPDVSMDPSVEYGCVPLSIEVINTSTIEPGSAYLWTFTEDNSFISVDSERINVIFDEEGTFDITLQIIGPNGCIGLGNLENPIITSSLIADFGYTPEDPRIDFDWIQLTALSQDAVDWDWTVNEDSLFSIASPLLNIDSLGVGFHEVCMTIINANGCSDRICKTLEITDNPLLWVPSAFSPNNDNLNELFKPIINGEDQIETYEFSIFNSIGRRIFTTNDMNASWGNNLIEKSKRPIGTYVWTASLKVKDIKEIVNYTGTVLILK